MLGLGQDNLHSTLVIWAKILLPLAALAVLSTLFMVSRPTAPEDAIPYAEVDIEDRLRDPRLTGASFAGMTEDGTAVTLKADEATPGPPGSSTAGAATGLVGLVETPDGISTRLTGATALLDQQNEQVTLGGGVTLTNSAGYDLQTDSLTLALDRTRLQSAGAVTATAPFGTITAGGMTLTRAPDGQYKLDFTGGVRLIYQPATP
jgi:lipopolysaccharide export system protein LptC